MEEKFKALLVKIWHSKPINFIRKHAGKYLIISLIFFGFFVWLGWKDTYKAPLWGQVEVYTEDITFRKVDKIEVYVNLGRTKIIYHGYNPRTGKDGKYTAWVDTKDIDSVRLLDAANSYYSSWGRIYGN